MKHIAVVGATGSTEKEVVRLALANYNVTVIARNPNLVRPENNLSVIAGDVTNLESLKEAFKDVDAVSIVLDLPTAEKPGILCLWAQKKY